MKVPLGVPILISGLGLIAESGDGHFGWGGVGGGPESSEGKSADLVAQVGKKLMDVMDDRPPPFCEPWI